MTSSLDIPHSENAGEAGPAAGDGFLYRFEAAIGLTPIGLVPEGLRMTVEFDGQVTAGAFPGARVWGIDPLLLRSDGVGVIDAAKTIAYGDVAVYERVNAYCIPPEGMEMPPLEALAQPGFEWPEVPFPIHGYSMFRASGPEHAYLNSAIARVHGQATFATGRLEIDVHLSERS